MILLLRTAFFLAVLASTARAAFHVMQIEQVIGSINGNTAAQAIQLRMRQSGQNVLSQASLFAADASGSNRVLLLNIASNVTNSSAGARVLLTTSAFNSAMIAGGSAAFTSDFTLASAIPASYLAAGRLTFEDDFGTIYWSLAWGGAAYTGSTTGNITNDSDGNFGKFGSGLPLGSFAQGLIFTGAASAASTSNDLNYTLTANPATVTRNSGTSFVIVPEPGTTTLLLGGTLVWGGLVSGRRRRV